MVIDFDFIKNNLSVIKVIVRLNNWGFLNIKGYCVVGVVKKVIDFVC